MLAETGSALPANLMGIVVLVTGLLTVGAWLAYLYR